MRNQSGNNTTEISHIGLFNSNRVWGGGEKWHYSTAFMMKKINVDVTVFGQTGCELLKRTHRSGISSIGIRVNNTSFLNPFKVVKLALTFKKLNIQAIILNLPSDVKFAGLAAKLAGVNKIIYRRGSPVFVRNTLMNRFLFRHILTDIIANSEQIKRSILQNNSKLTNDGKITIIYNGVDSLLPMEKDSGGEPPARTQGLVLGTAGRLSQEKGMDWLIKMAHELKAKKLDFTLLIAGEGPLMEPLKQKSHEAGLDEYICFCGFVADMEKFYGSLDLFILTSAWEGCSNVILEAMHSGLPVVAFDNSSIPEMVRDNISGFLVRNKDGRELADKVELLARDPLLRAQFGKAGQKIVREKYDQNAAFNQLMTLIRQ